MRYNEPTTKEPIMHNLPKSAVITIKIIDFVDSKFDRFRK